MWRIYYIFHNPALKKRVSCHLLAFSPLLFCIVFVVIAGLMLLFFLLLFLFCFFYIFVCLFVSGV